MSNRRSSTNLLHPGVAFCFNATASMTTVMKQRNQTEGCRFLYSFFSRKKLSKMVVERVRGRRTASSRAGTETRTSRSRATMAPTLRPRTPRKGGDASGVTPEGHGTRSRRGTSRDEKSRDGPKARSFALSSSGWLFVYYVGVVKALAERGYHKCVSFSQSRGAVVAHPTSSSRVARRCRLNARAFPRPTRAADLFRAPRSSDLRTRARRTAAETTSSGDPNTERDAPYPARA